jgi:ABC-2 type transport system ATP-binding protein
MSNRHGLLARPAGRDIRMAGDNAEHAAQPGPGDGALPLAVDLQGVRKSFGSVRAVRGVALAVSSGEVMAFLGPNGAGKTSTIDMILGLSRPDAGAVEVYGMAPRQAVRRGLVSAVMQTGGLLKDLAGPSGRRSRCRLPGGRGHE